MYIGHLNKDFNGKGEKEGRGGMRDEVNGRSSDAGVALVVVVLAIAIALICCL